MSRIVLLVAVAFGLAGVAGAQESRGTIQGTVKDPQGAVVAGANVVVTNTDTQANTSTEIQCRGPLYRAAVDAGELYGHRWTRRASRKKFSKASPC